jgi:tetratricopeptide (TPR) repeat protein
MLGLRSPLPDLAHVDLLHLARRLWRDRLPSRTLGNLEVQILGTLRSEQDIPGWMIPQIYFDYLRSRDPAPLKNVFYHNAMDVLSLAALLNHSAGLLSDPLSLGGAYAIDLIALAKLFEDLGDLDRATLLYIHGLEHEDALQERIPAAVLLQALQRLALIRKRQNDLPAAIHLWEQAALHHHLEAHVELAKCYEHQLRDFEQAIQWTEAAMRLIELESPFDAYQRRQWMLALERRLERLRQKLSRTL